jgi:hypothetical protein
VYSESTATARSMGAVRDVASQEAEVCGQRRGLHALLACDSIVTVGRVETTAFGCRPHVQQPLSMQMAVSAAVVWPYVASPRLRRFNATVVGRQGFPPSRPRFGGSLVATPQVLGGEGL